MTKIHPTPVVHPAVVLRVPSGRLACVKRSELFERNAVIAGASTAFLTAAMGLGVALAFRALFDWSSGGTTALASFFVLAGCILGGFRAGLGAPHSPLSNGAASATIAGVAISIVQRLLSGNGIRPVALIFVALLCGSLGVFGGVVANTSNRTRALRKR